MKSRIGKYRTDLIVKITEERVNELAIIKCIQFEKHKN